MSPLGLSELQGTVLSTRIGILVLTVPQGHPRENETGSGYDKASKSVSARKPTTMSSSNSGIK